jgi:hypothetical protein
MDVLEKYSKFENILPEELLSIDFNELVLIHEEIKKIMNEDLDNIKKICAENNNLINFDDFKNIEYLLQLGFFAQNDPAQEDDKFQSAHWYMSMVTLDVLSKAICDLSKPLVEYYNIYMDPATSIFDKKQNFNRFVRTWQDLYGYKINIQNTICQYYDLYVLAINKIDPNRNETPFYLAKSDTSPEGLHAAVMELILHGNRGRLEGFALLRSMLEIHITRNLFNLNSIPRYKGKMVVPANKYLPSINAICNSIDRLKYDSIFKTDIIRRVYDWGSIVSHRGLRTDEYITWFIRGAIAQICNLFSIKLDVYREKILDNLVTTNQIKIV